MAEEKAQDARNQPVKLENDKSYDFGQALYYALCPTCGGGLTWEAEFDADGTEYSANCCENLFRMSPATVLINIESLEDAK